MKFMRSLLSLFATVLHAPASANTNPPDKPDIVLGVQLEVPLETQFEPCRMEGDRAQRFEDKHCWTRTFYGREVLHSIKLLGEIGWVEFRNIREMRGVVVEVEAQFHPRDVKRVERYLRQRLGPPTESEQYERDSRLFFGSRHSMAHTWKDANATIHFLEMSANDMGSVRGFSNRWAAEELEFQKSLELR